MRVVAVRLEDLGHEVTSTWVWRTDTNIENLFDPDASLVAVDDVIDVIRADTIIAFTEYPRTTNTRGARHTEFGISVGLAAQAGAGKRRLIVCGPREHIFHCVPDVEVYDCWQDLDQQLTLERITLTRELQPWKTMNETR